MSVTEFPRKPDNIPAIKGGERNGHDIIIDGHVVPNMWMIDCGATIELCFPGPVHYIFPRDIAAHVAGACAKAMAVGAGHSHVSSTHATTKAYGPKAMCISSVNGDEPPVKPA